MRQRRVGWGGVLGIAVGALLGCGEAQPSESPRGAQFAARKVARTLADGAFEIPPLSEVRTEAPLDPEVSDLPGARAFWLGEEGERIYVLEVPSRTENGGPPVVLVHGLGGAGMRDFYAVVAQLSERRDVFLLDLPGLGRSELGEREPSPRVFAGIVAAVVRALIQGPFDLVGHSLGGNVALTAAGHPQVHPRRLVLVDVAGVLHRQAFAGSQVDAGAASLASVHGGLSGVVSGVGSRLVEATSMFDPGDDSVLKSGVMSAQTRAAMQLIVHDVSPFLEAISAPTLLLWGDRDRVAPLRTALLLRERLAHPRMKLFPGVGHVPMETASESWSREVTGFLDHPAAPPGHAPSNVRASAIPKAPSRNIDCDGAGHAKLDEQYDQLELRKCENVRIEGAVIGQLLLFDSTVEIVGGRVARGIVADDSVIVATGGTWSGEVALYLVDSEADLAGTAVLGRAFAIGTKDGARLLLSAVSIRSPHNEGSIHDQVDLQAGEAL